MALADVRLQINGLRLLDAEDAEPRSSRRDKRLTAYTVLYNTQAAC